MMKHITLLAIGLLAVLLLAACDGDGAPQTIDEPNSAALKVLADAQLRDAKRTQDIANAKAAQEAADKKRKDDDAAREVAKANALAEVAERNAKTKADEETRRLENEKKQAELAEQKRLSDLKVKQAEDEARAAQEARTRQAKLDQEKADAEAARIALEQKRAEADAQHAQSDAEFFNGLWRVVAMALALALFVLGVMFAQTFIDARATRNKFIETRTGTVLIIPVGRGQYTAQLLNQPSLPPMADDEFAASEAQMIDAEADAITFRTPKGDIIMPRHDPLDAAAEANRKLAMRLLRAAMQQVGGQSGRIPTYKDLGWSGETWQKAINAFRPYLIIKEGRGGGTFCGSDYPTLAQLYCAIGERRVRLTPRAPLPHRADVSNIAANVLPNVT